MSDPKSGTPDPTQQTANNAGTAGSGQDGGEAASAKPVDPALAMAWKSKAEDYNRVQAELEQARQQLAAAQQAQYQQQSNPADEMWRKLQEDAARGDYVAGASVYALQAAQINQARAQLAVELTVVPFDLRETVKNIVEQSGYRTSVADARKQAETLSRGEKYGDMEQRLAALEAENKRLQEEQSRRRVSTAVVSSGAPPDTGQYDISASEYRAIIRGGGSAAMALKAEVDSGKKRVDYTR